MSQTLDALRASIIAGMNILMRELGAQVRTLCTSQDSYNEEWNEWDSSDTDARGEEPEDPGHSDEIQHLEEQMIQLEDAEQLVEDLTWEAGA